MAYEVPFTIWQGGQLAIPLKTTLAKVKTILGAVYTLAMLCSIIHRVHRVVMADFWRTFHHEGKISLAGW